MKRTILIFAVLFFSGSAFAQTAKDSLLKLMATDVCTELSDNKNADPGKGLEERMTEAFIPLLSKYSDGISKYYDLESDVEGKGYRQLGIDIGIKMMGVCPDAMKNLMKDKPDENKDAAVAPKQMTLTGTLIKIVPGELTYFSVKTNAGQLQKVWWMEYFDGSEKLTAIMYNKPITVQYYEKEVYNAAINDYVKIKVAARVK